MALISDCPDFEPSPRRFLAGRHRLLGKVKKNFSGSLWTRAKASNIKPLAKTGFYSEFQVFYLPG